MESVNQPFRNKIGVIAHYDSQLSYGLLLSSSNPFSTRVYAIICNRSSINIITPLNQRLQHPFDFIEKRCPFAPLLNVESKLNRFWNPFPTPALNIVEQNRPDVGANVEIVFPKFYMHRLSSGYR